MSVDGDIQEKGKYPTPTKEEESVPEFVESLGQIYDKYKDQGVEGIALSLPGLIDAENGIIRNGGGIKYLKDAHLAELLGARCDGVKISMENDGKCAALAEVWMGNAKGCKNAMVIAIGTGLGLGVMVDGRLLKGKSGLGAEAHFGIARGKVRRCSCGNWDCYEVYASGTALGVDAQEAYHDKSKTSHDIIAGIQAGDKKAREVFDLWQDDVLTGIVGLANLFDPEVVLMFGGLTDYLDYERLEKEANSRIVTAPFKLCRARFEHNAALIGAALIALHNLEVK